jgi:hypothetical protein
VPVLLSALCLVVGGALSADHFRAASRALPDQARTVTGPGAFAFDARQSAVWTLLSLDGDSHVDDVTISVIDLDTRDAVDVTTSHVVVDPRLTDAAGVRAAFDIGVRTPGRYQLTINSDAPVAFQLVDDVDGRVAAAGRSLARASGMVFVATGLALLLLLVAFFRVRARPRPRATAPRRVPPPLPARPPSAPNALVGAPAARGLAITPADHSVDPPNTRRVGPGLYRALNAPPPGSDPFDEETEALDLPPDAFHPQSSGEWDVWNVPTAA